MAGGSSGQTAGLAIGLAVGFGVLWFARSREAPVPAPAAADEAASGPVMTRPQAPPRPKPKFPASLDMFVSANNRAGTTVSDGGDPMPKLPKPGTVAQVDPVRSPAAEREADAEIGRKDETLSEGYWGEPDTVGRAPAEPRRNGAMVLRFAGVTALVLVFSACFVGYGRSGGFLAGAAVLASAATAVMGLAARSQLSGMEPAAWLGLAAFSAIVAFSRFGGATPSDPRSPR